MTSIAPTQTTAMDAVQAFLVSVLPPGTPVVLGQPNRVAEPDAETFVVMTPMRFPRLRTNIDTPADVRFVGSIAGNVMTVTAAGDPNTDTFGAILIGATVFGQGLAGAPQVVDQTGGTPGGIGTYTLSGNPQTIGSEVLASGAMTYELAGELAVQLDFHSVDLSAGDLAATVSTLWRDEYAVTKFAELAPGLNIVPLYADDPRQLPFTNEEQQVETRWSLDAMLQVNAVVSTPQQFADSVEVTVVSVEATYPPT